MFDLGFSEIAVIGAVALVVLGPERLPVVARTAGKLFSKAQSMVSQVKEDIERETELAELKEIEKQAKSIAEDVSRSVKGEVDAIRGEVESIKKDVNSLGQDVEAQAKEIKETGESLLNDEEQNDSEVQEWETWDDSVSPVESKSFGKRYRSSPSVEELAEEVERLRTELGERSPQLGSNNRRLAARARVNRVRIYR